MRTRELKIDQIRTISKDRLRASIGSMTDEEAALMRESLTAPRFTHYRILEKNGEGGMGVV